MYEELVKALLETRERVKSNHDVAMFVPPYQLSAAADAIEKLSAYARQFEDLRKDGYYLQKTKMMTYGQATMTMPLPEPPKEET